MPTELNGVVVVDKPGGLSSAGVVSRIKRLFGANKAGHTGTLDPFATGVLICCINRATRLSRFFLEGGKTYEAVLCLGMETDTQDATGAVTATRSIDGITRSLVEQAAERFSGDISQIPPAYSALKHEGTPLYKLARRGMVVEKPARQVTIHRLDIVDVDLPEVRLTVACSSGTYIRTLCADMGRDLGCGGHLKALRRTGCCGFSSDDAINLEGLEALGAKGRLAERVINMREALHFMPETIVGDTLAGRIANGMKLSPEDFRSHPEVPEKGDFKVVDRSGRLIAVLKATGTGGHYIYCCVFRPQR